MRALHGQIGRLDGAVPVEEIAKGLGIAKVRQAELDGCEGVLLTDPRRSIGKILVNSRRGRRAARFGIGHELGHFLMERHVLGLAGLRTCSRLDMRAVRTARRYDKQEVEANEFAIGLLAPSYLVAPTLAEQPDLEAVLSLRDRLDLSLEACMRCLVERHDEPLAAVWTKGGIIQHLVRNDRFPWIAPERGDRVSALTRTQEALARGAPGMTRMAETPPGAWTGADIPELFEQVRIGKGGYSLTLLWATLADANED